MNEPTKLLQVKLPTRVHEALFHAAALNGRTVKEYLTRVLLSYPQVNRHIGPVSEEESVNDEVILPPASSIAPAVVESVSTIAPVVPTKQVDKTPVVPVEQTAVAPTPRDVWTAEKARLRTLRESAMAAGDSIAADTALEAIKAHDTKYPA